MVPLEVTNVDQWYLLIRSLGSFLLGANLDRGVGRYLLVMGNYDIYRY